jgi:hypothetical protein
MARPGFYNDNEYRAYPFVQNDTAVGLPAATIVDAGFIMGLDCDFETETNTVWLHSVTRGGGVVSFTFKTDAHPALLTFAVPETAEEWSTVYAESAAESKNCAEEPVWSGFIVVGLLADVSAANFAATDFVVEPGRLQNLAKSYLRSISVGNYSRVTVPPCSDENADEIIDLDSRTIITNATCLKNHIRFEEGYNCRITQIDRTSTIDFAAERGAGKKEDSELCENSGEVPLTENESKPDGSQFYSGGPACKDLLFTVNGVGGRNVNFIGGKNIAISTGDDGTSVKITLNQNIQGGCNE